MKRKKQLNRLLMVRELACQQARESLAAEQSRLVQEEQRLEQLQQFRESCSWKADTRVSGLTLDCARMMVDRIGQAVAHQQHQVAVQEVSCRSVQAQYQVEKRQVKTAEVILDKHLERLDLKDRKQEQNIMDEFATRRFSAGF